MRNRQNSTPDSEHKKKERKEPKPVTAAPPPDMDKHGLTPRRHDDQDHYRDDR